MKVKRQYKPMTPGELEAVREGIKLGAGIWDLEQVAGLVAIIDNVEAGLQEATRARREFADYVFKDRADSWFYSAEPTLEVSEVRAMLRGEKHIEEPAAELMKKAADRFRQERKQRLSDSAKKGAATRRAR